MIESEATGQKIYITPAPMIGYGNFGAGAAPTTDDDEINSYSVNSIWYKVTIPYGLWICTDNTTGAAVWREIPLSDYRSTRTVFNHNNDLTTAGTSRETILTESVPITTLFQHGDAIFFRIAGRYAANANDKLLFLSVAGTDIAESDTQTSNGGKWEIDGFFERKNNATLKYEAEFTTSGVAPQLREGTIAGLDLINDAIPFLLDARTPTSAGDVTMALCRAWLMPGKNLVEGGLTFLGEAVTFLNAETAFNS